MCDEQGPWASCCLVLAGGAHFAACPGGRGLLLLPFSLTHRPVVNAPPVCAELLHYSVRMKPRAILIAPRPGEKSPMPLLAGCSNFLSLFADLGEMMSELIHRTKPCRVHSLEVSRVSCEVEKLKRVGWT